MTGIWPAGAGRSGGPAVAFACLHSWDGINSAAAMHFCAIIHQKFREELKRTAAAKWTRNVVTGKVKIGPNLNVRKGVQYRRGASSLFKFPSGARCLSIISTRC